MAGFSLAACHAATKQKGLLSLTISRPACAKIGPHRQSYRRKTIGDQPVSDDNKNETTEAPTSNDVENDPAPEENAPSGLEGVNHWATVNTWH